MRRISIIILALTLVVLLLTTFIHYTMFEVIILLSYSILLIYFISIWRHRG